MLTLNNWPYTTLSFATPSGTENFSHQTQTSENLVGVKPAGS